MRVNCFKCKHFFVTWDPRSPRGCAAYQFKTKQVPSVVVKQSSGMECMKFVLKEKQGEKR